MRVVDLNFREAFTVYQNSRAQLGMNEHEVPDKFIELAAHCARNVINAFCRKNDLELVDDLENRDDMSQGRH